MRSLGLRSRFFFNNSSSGYKCWWCHQTQDINAQMVYLTNEELSSREEKATVLWYANPYIYYYPLPQWQRNSRMHSHSYERCFTLCCVIAGEGRHKHGEKNTNIKIVTGLVFQRFTFAINKWYMAAHRRHMLLRYVSLQDTQPADCK